MNSRMQSQDKIDQELTNRIFENSSNYLYQDAQLIKQSDSNGNHILQIQEKNQTKQDQIFEMYSNQNNCNKPPTIHIFEPQATLRNQSIPQLQDSVQRAIEPQVNFEVAIPESLRSSHTFSNHLLSQYQANNFFKVDNHWKNRLILVELIFFLVFSIYIIKQNSFSYLGRWNKGIDTNGQLCGFDEAKDYQFIYFNNPQKNYFSQRVCIDECPEQAQESINCFKDGQPIQQNQILNITNPKLNFQIYTTFKYLNSVCIPQNIEYFYQTLENYNYQFIQQTLADIWLLKYTFFSIYLITIFIKFLTEKTIKISVTKIYISSIFLILLIGLGGIYFFYIYKKLQNIDNIENQLATTKVDFSYVIEHTSQPLPYLALIISISLTLIFYTIFYLFYQLQDRIKLLFVGLKLIKKFQKSKKMLKLVIIINLIKFFIFIMFFYTFMLTLSPPNFQFSNKVFQNGISTVQYLLSIILYFKFRFVLFLMDNLLCFFTSSLFIEWYGIEVIKQSELDKSINFQIPKKKTILYHFGSVIGLTFITYFTDSFVFLFNRIKFICNILKLKIQLTNFDHFSSLSSLSVILSERNCNLSDGFQILQKLNKMQQPQYKRRIIELSQIYGWLNKYFIGFLIALIMCGIQKIIFHNQLFSQYPGIIVGFMIGLIVSESHYVEIQSSIQSLLHIYFLEQEQSLLKEVLDIYKRRNRKKMISLIEQQIMDFNQRIQQ